MINEYEPQLRVLELKKKTKNISPYYARRTQPDRP